MKSFSILHFCHFCLFGCLKNKWKKTTIFDFKFNMKFSNVHTKLYCLAKFKTHFCQSSLLYLYIFEITIFEVTACRT